MAGSEDAHPAKAIVPIPWRCATCRHDATGLIIGMACPECGSPLNEASIRPAWLEPRSLRRIRLASRIAIAATFSLAFFPPVVLGFRSQGFVVPAWVVMPTLVIVTAGAVVAQTSAMLRLLWSATSPARGRFDVVALLLRAALQFIVFAGSFGFLSRPLVGGTLVAPWNGPLPGSAKAWGGISQWAGAILLQATLVLPVMVIDVLLARRAAAIAIGISDDRPAWTRLEWALKLISWWLGVGGAMCIAIPLTGWAISPLMWLVGHIVLFRAIEQMAGLHLGTSTDSVGDRTN